MLKEKISVFELVLIIVCIGSFVAKIIYEIFCWHITRKFNRDKTGKKKCIHLIIQGGNQVCRENKLNKNKCEKTNCSMYKTSEKATAEILQEYKILFYISLFIDFLSQFSGIILIISSLIK